MKNVVDNERERVRGTATPDEDESPRSNSVAMICAPSPRQHRNVPVRIVGYFLMGGPGRYIIENAILQKKDSSSLL